MNTPLGARRKIGANERNAEFQAAENQQRGHQQHRSPCDVPGWETLRQRDALADKMDPQRQRQVPSPKHAMNAAPESGCPVTMAPTAAT